MLEAAAYGILVIARSLLFPVIIIWAFANLAMGMSMSYLMRCVYLELELRIRRSLAAPPAAATAASDTAASAGGVRGSELAGKPNGACRPRPPNLTEEQKRSAIRGVSVLSEAEYLAKGQTRPPATRVSALFGKEGPPAGEERPYDAACSSRVARRGGLLGFHFGGPPREAKAEGPEQDDAWAHRLQCLREGAEVHRQARQFVQQQVRPGMELREIVEMVEKASSSLVGFDPKNPLRRGYAFPTGLSLNEVAAHDTVNPGDAPRWLLPTDLAKLDIGVHVEGHILDCAFSFTFDSMHDELMQAVRDATNEGIRHAGPDALIAEVGGVIREVMESGEVHRPDGKVMPIYAIKNLTGHSIAPYRIHAGKSLPSVNAGGRVRMLAGELWAVETFGSAGGVGFVCNAGPCSHFMRPHSGPVSKLQSSTLSSRAKAMLELIERRFSTLAFCPRWVVEEATRCKSPLLQGCASGAKAVGGGRGGGHDAQRWWSEPLEELCNMGVVNRYPPLADLPGCYTAQYEHTVLLKNSGKEVLTRGADF